MAATRVYILARELGVKSGAIVEKCQAEGLDIKNHMSTISAGLAATIREWFSEGEHATTVETAEKVDLKKVRVKKKKKKKPAAPKKEVAEETPAPEQPEVAAAEAAGEQEQTAPESPEQEPLRPAAQAPPAAGKPPAQQEPPKQEPVEPQPIGPAGPMLEKPKPAELTGPNVVRVEAPEVIQPPASRQRAPRPPRPPRTTVPTQPLMGIPEHLPAATGGKRQKGKKRPRTTRRKGGAEEEAELARKTSPLREFREKDIQERRARLEAAGAESLRLRPSRKIETRKPGEAVAKAKPEKAVVTEPITVKALSAALALKTSDIIQKLMAQGVMATANQSIAPDTAELLAMEFGVELEIQRRPSAQQQIAEEFEKRPRKNLQKRPPVVTMLGHVDHGKTSLLDKIRAADVVSGEAGGITQHIGAYQIEWDGKAVTFLDTPGHEAFTSMRARGANMTDIVVLVVAADDGVMPQTIEAINHAKAAGVPIIVALNKIDLPGSDENRIYGQLAEYELTPIEWGGHTEVVKTSALTGQGVQDLLEHLDLLAELLELKADPDVPATGWVIEARMTQHLGPVASVLVKEGRLCKQDVVLAGCSSGRIRTLRDSRNREIDVATSSMPVEITGIDDVPQAGDRFFQLEDLNQAKSAAEENKNRRRQETLARRQQVTLDNLFTRIEAGNVKELNLIIKADVQGSVDVLLKYLAELSTDEVKIKILHAGVGGITEGDVLLAEASEAIIIGFNVVADDAAAKKAEAAGVDIRLYNVIYRITEDLKKAMQGLLEPEIAEKKLGRATVRNTFTISSVGTVAGVYVTTGLVKKSAKARLIRDNIVINDGLTIQSLKRFKDDVREVKSGFECGLKIDGFDDIKMEDVFEFYEEVEVARSL